MDIILRLASYSGSLIRGDPVRPTRNSPAGAEHLRLTLCHACARCVARRALSERLLLSAWLMARIGVCADVARCRAENGGCCGHGLLESLLRVEQHDAARNAQNGVGHRLRHGGSASRREVRPRCEAGACSFRIVTVLPYVEISTRFRCVDPVFDAVMVRRFP